MSALDLILLGWAVIATLLAARLYYLAHRWADLFTEAIDQARIANAGWKRANDAMLEGMDTLNAAQRIIEAAPHLPPTLTDTHERLN